jgi:hypothetical protein
MFEIVDCEGGAFLAMMFLVTKLYVQRFFSGKKMVQIFQILKEREKSVQICIKGSNR